MPRLSCLFFAGLAPSTPRSSRRARRIAIAAAATALAAGAPPALAAPAPASSACADALVIHEWRADLALVADLPAEAAVGKLRRIAAWQNASFVDNRPDTATAAVGRDLWDALRAFDLRKMYDTLPDSIHPPWRALNLRFTLEDAHYRGTLTEPDSIGDPLPALGTARFRLAMRPKTKSPNVSDPDRYEIQSRWRSNFGPMRWRNLWRAFQLRLDTLVNAAPVAAPLARQTAAVTRNPTLGQADQPILAQLWTGFPATANWFTDFASIDHLRQHDAGAPSDRQHLHLVLSLDDARLERQYPTVADYLAQIGNVIDTHTVVRNARGRWLSIDVDSAERRLTVDGWLVDGRLVPSRNGQPIAAGNDSPGSPSRFETVTDMQTHSFGIHVAVRDQRVHWTYRHDGDGAHFVGWLRDQPTVTVSGRAFGIVPVGVLAALSPISMQGVMDDFMGALIASNDGRGALFKIDVGDDAAGDNVLSNFVDADVLDNFFVHFGVQMANKRLLPNAEALAGLRRIAADGIQAFTRDLDRRAALIGRAGACPAMMPQSAGDAAAPAP